MNNSVEISIRRWFARNCPIDSGIVILKQLNVDSRTIKLIEGKAKEFPAIAKGILRKIVNSIDPISLELNYEFNYILSLLNESESPPTLKEAVPTPIPVLSGGQPIKSVDIKIVDSPTVSDEVVSNVYQDIEKKKGKKNEPPQIKALREKAILLHKQHAYLKFQLDFSKSDGDRYKIARELMEDVIPKLDKIYDTIRYWEKTGDIPEIPEKEDFKKGVETILKKESLRTRVAKINRILKGKLSNKKRAEYQKELLDKEIELQDIIQLLNTL